MAQPMTDTGLHAGSEPGLPMSRFNEHNTILTMIHNQ